MGGGDESSSAEPLAAPESSSPTDVRELPLPTDLPAQTCLDWVSFETPREAASDAGAVLLGTVVERSGTAEFYGVDSTRWMFDVERVLERPEPLREGAELPPEIPVSAGDRISIVSTPETCSGDGDPYPSGDPLDPATGRQGADGTVIVVLSGAWGDDSELGEPSLITPYQGVLTPTDDGALPAEWPAP